MGFILTKWYVNKRGFKELIKRDLSFILTKWYVNKTVLNKKKTEPQQVLY